MFLRIRKLRLKLNASKCYILRKKFNYLSHNITAEGITADPEKIEAVLRMPMPKNLKQLRSFLGKCNYYRKYIKYFNTLRAPLHDVNTTEFVWNEQANTAFNSMKILLTQIPILIYPDFTKPFIVSTATMD